MARALCGANHSLRSKRLVVVDTRKSERARRGHARPFSLSPTTSKRLIRWLG